MSLRRRSGFREIRAGLRPADSPLGSAQGLSLIHILKAYTEGIHRLLRARLCANHPEQYAIKVALEGPQDHLVEVQRKLRSRRDLTQKWCEATPRVSCVAPRGAFYAFPRIDIPESDEVFVKELIRQKHVMVVHGSGFGQKAGTQHFRIVFLPDEVTLSRAYSSIGEFIAERYAAFGS